MTVSTRKGMLDLTPNAITVLERRYLVKDDHGAPVEGPEDLFWRGSPPPAPPPPRGGGGDGAGAGAAPAVLPRLGPPASEADSPPRLNAPPPPPPPACRLPRPR